jgi:hypothetical protein
MVSEKAMNYAQMITVVIVAALGFKFVPETAYPVVGVVFLAWVINEFPKWNRQRKLEKAKQKQLDADAPLRDEFRVKHKAIRRKYDPNNEWNEATSLPYEYQQEMDELNREYRAVMDRWHNQ